MIHKMHINNDQFSRIKNGTKTVEKRLNDEKRQQLKVKDLVEFTNRITGENITAQIVNLYEYPSFEELYKHFDKISMGYDKEDDADSKDMEQYYSKEDLEKYARLLIATEDGSAGTKGNVLTAMEEKKEEADVIMACGPMPMLRAIKAYAGDKKIKAYLSLEERMACGVGACLGCVCKTTRKDGHSHVNNTRICTEGPVFEAGEVDI